jgi:hypothetical protein
MIALPLLLGGASNIGSLSKGTKRKLFDKRALTDIPLGLCYVHVEHLHRLSFTILLYAFLLADNTAFIAYLSPYFHMPSFSQTILHTSASAATRTLIVSQMSSIPGRLAAAVAAHYLGVMVPWVICVVVSGLLCLSWIFVHTNSAYLAFCTLYGAYGIALEFLRSRIW